MNPRPWWIFRLPESVAHVPAETELAARSVLARHCYPGAPVDAWPCLGSRWAGRERIATP